jgi:hypothetical protein
MHSAFEDAILVGRWTVAVRVSMDFCLYYWNLMMVLCICENGGDRLVLRGGDKSVLCGGD